MIIRNLIKSIFLPLLVLFVWLIFEEKLMHAFDTNILPTLADLKFSNITTLLFFLITLLPFYGIYKCIKNKYYIPYQTFLILSIFAFIYFKHRLSGNYISTPSTILNLGYTDIGVVILVIFLLSCLFSFFNYRNKNENDESDIFISDMPILNPQSDILDYSESAKQFAEDLEKLQLETSCSVGLIAPWGTGKTSYLNLLEYHLDKDKFIVIKFNPRYSKDINNIQEDFFNELFSKLSNYDLRFLSTFKDYLKSINIANENKIVSSIFNFYKIFNKEDEKNKINNAILKLNKRIVVVIEDFDRLLSDEIIEVFKLIDGNASFSNIIFITAYDKTHINDIIGKTYSNEETLFSDKFFNIEKQIPLRPYDKIYQYIESQLLERINIDVKDEDLYKSTLVHHVELLKKYIITLRDAKRFLNLFIHQYVHVKDEVEFKDYFLLYLIKYKYLEEYLKLYKKEVVSTNILKSPNQMSLNVHTEMKSKEILDILFPEEPSYKLRSINNSMAFDIYFHENVYGHLKLADMEQAFKQDEDYKKLIQQFIAQKTIQDFISFIDSKNILALQSRERFERYFDICLYLYIHNIESTISYFKILALIYTENGKEIQENYKYKDHEYRDIVLTKLKGIYPEYPYGIVRAILIGIINNEFNEKIIFKKEDILNVAISSLQDLIKNDKHISQQHIELLYGCISDINPTTRIITLDKDSCSVIKEYITKKPAGYFKNFVRLGMISFNKEFNSIACEPFWEQIFNDKTDLESFIREQSESAIPNINLIQNFWELYKNNNYNPIEFQNQGDVQEKIDKGLINEIKKLNKLLEIEDILQKYEEEKSNDSSTHDDTFYLEQCKKLLSDIDENGLHIAKTDEIRTKIQSIISSMS